MRTRIVAALPSLLLVVLATALVPSGAEAAARITATNEFGKAEADVTYATELALQARGFQSIRNGHGGVYVFFGTVRGTWRPSQGGQTGRDYLYVPDSEAKNNAGYQRFLAFPGSDTASSAQGVVKADGSWSTTITVPGARFTAVDRDGKPVSVDCTKVRCGIITIGAHGVKNARNETFTPIRFGTVYDDAPATSTTQTPSAGQPTAPSAPSAPTAPRSQAPAGVPAGTPAAPAAAPTAAVDGDTAVVGRVMSFTGGGFTPGEQVTASFDEGRAAVGPLPAGSSGEVAGVLQLPAGTRPGTHTLRLTGAASGTRVDINFPVRADAPAAAAGAAADEVSGEGLPGWAGWTFLGVSAVLLVLAVGSAVRRIGATRAA